MASKQPVLTFKNIWNDNSYHERVLEYWSSLKALPPYVNPIQRVKQLVFIALDGEDIAAVTTAERKSIKMLGGIPMWSFRILIHPKYRIPGLMDKMSLMTKEFLESLFREGKSDCIGMITAVENRKLQKARKEAVYPVTKLAFAGYTSEGHQIRLVYFDGATV